MFALRLIDPNDYIVLDDGHTIGRIRLDRDRSPPIWLWTVTVTIPGGPFGNAKSIDEAKQRFKRAWMAFKQRVGEEALAKCCAEMNHANRPDRYQR
jgi:hypothetical protein